MRRTSPFRHWRSCSSPRSLRPPGQAGRQAVARLPSKRAPVVARHPRTFPVAAIGCSHVRAPSRSRFRCPIITSSFRSAWTVVSRFLVVLDTGMPIPGLMLHPGPRDRRARTWNNPDDWSS